MSEVQKEQEQPKKQVSGMWAVLVFVALLAIVITLAVATQ
jgi:hypothetical protein